MILRISAFLQVLVLAARTALAEPAAEPEGLPPPDGEIEVLAHAGVASAPFDVSTLPEAKGQALVLVASGRARLSERLAIELHAPLVLGSVEQPAGSYVDAAALGNPQLGARYRLLERRSSKTSSTLFGAFEVGLPLASHAEDLMPNRALAIGDGIEGRGHPEWFTPGALPLTASSAFRWVRAAWILEAQLRLPLLLRVSDADLPSATTSTKGVGFGAVLGGEARYRLSRRLSLAAAAHLFFDVAPIAEHATFVSRLQDFERLGLLVNFGALAALVIDLQTAIGGELGGSTFAGGLRAVVSFR